MNTEQEALVNRLTEAGISLRRFIRVGGDKAPQEPTNWQNNLHTPEEMNGSAGWGVVGRDGLVLIDTDNEDMAKEIGRILPHTFVSVSPRRKMPHFYYHIPDGDVPNRVLKLPGESAGAGEIRAQNQYLVAPGSQVQWGKYEIMHDRPIATLDYPTFMRKIEPLLGVNTKQPITKEAMREGVESGTRHHYGIRMATYLIAVQKFDRGTAIHEMKRWNELNDPPMAGHDLERMVDYAISQHGVAPIEDKHYTPASFFDGFTDSNGKHHRGEFVPMRLAEAILSKHTFATMEENEEMFIYTDGVYLPNAKTVINAEAQQHLAQLCKNNHVLETVAYIRRGSYQKAETFGGPVELLAVNNGVLNLDTGEFTDHSPDNMFLTKLPVDYDPAATCPKIEQFFADVLKPDDIAVVQEGFGYCLWKDYTYAKAFMFLAEGENGKSQLLRLLSELIGGDNICNHSIHKLIFDRFSTVDLFGKLLNVHADIPDGELGKTGVFKMLTGRDRMQGERKGLQGKVPFYNHAKMFFSTNQLPQTDDTTHAFFRRWILIRFPFTFTKDPVGQLQKKDNPDILKEIITPESLSGLLNWVLIGLARLRKEGKFSDSKTSEETMSEWVASSDSLKYFVIQRIEDAPGNHINKEEFYNAYRKFAGDASTDILTTRKVTERIPTLIPGVYLGRPGAEHKGEKRPQAWINIKFKESQERHTSSNSLEDLNDVDTDSIRSSKMDDFCDTNDEPRMTIRSNGQPVYCVRCSEVATIRSQKGVPLCDDCATSHRGDV